MEERGYATLEHITAKYPVVLLDNCALQNSAETGRVTPERSLWDFLARTMSFAYFTQFAKAEGKLYLAQETVDELSAGLRNSDHKKVIKKCGRLRAKQHKLHTSCKEVMEHEICEAEAARDYFKMRANLIGAFRDLNKIFVLQEQERPLFKYFFNKHLDLKQKKYCKSQTTISDVDYTLMLYGAVSSQTRAPTALVTRDYPLLVAWADFMHREHISVDNYRVYIRVKDHAYMPGFVRKRS